MPTVMNILDRQEKQLYYLIDIIMISHTTVWRLYDE